jgi:hypothetical protein
MLKVRWSSSLLVAVLVICQGCVAGPPDEPSTTRGPENRPLVNYPNSVSGSPLPDGSLSTEAMPVDNGALRGDIGDVTGIDGATDRVTGERDRYFAYSTVSVVVEKLDGSAGMAFVELSGIYADLATAPSGVYRVLSSGFGVDPAAEHGVLIDLSGDEGELPATYDDAMTVMLCSGPSRDTWAYDVLADDVVIEIEDPVVHDVSSDCTACEPSTTRSVTFVADSYSDDGSGAFVRSRASGVFSLRVANSLETP